MISITVILDITLLVLQYKTVSNIMVKIAGSYYDINLTT